MPVIDWVGGHYVGISEIYNYYMYCSGELTTSQIFLTLTNNISPHTHNTGIFVFYSKELL